MAETKGDVAYIHKIILECFFFMYSGKLQFDIKLDNLHLLRILVALVDR